MHIIGGKAEPAQQKEFFPAGLPFLQTSPFSTMWKMRLMRTGGEIALAVAVGKRK
ncbi:MAG: hypothetical protein ACUVSW_08060 [Roseiflexus sp.]